MEILDNSGCRVYRIRGDDVCDNSGCRVYRFWGRTTTDPDEQSEQIKKENTGKENAGSGDFNMWERDWDLFPIGVPAREKETTESLFERLDYGIDASTVGKIAYYVALFVSAALAVAALISFAVEWGFVLIFDIEESSRILYWILTGVGGGIALSMLILDFVLVVNDSANSGSMLLPLALVVVNTLFAFGSLTITLIVPAGIAYWILAWSLTKFADRFEDVTDFFRNLSWKNILFAFFSFASFAIAISAFVCFCVFDGSNFTSTLWELPALTEERLILYASLIGSGGAVALGLVVFDWIAAYNCRKEYGAMRFPAFLLSLNAAIVFGGIPFLIFFVLFTFYCIGKLMLKYG